MLRYPKAIFIMDTEYLSFVIGELFKWKYF